MKPDKSDAGSALKLRRATKGAADRRVAQTEFNLTAMLGLQKRSEDGNAGIV